jgi:anaerobic magnesium-protoporphyrin IX monomethyl ester cyclase
MKPRPRVVLYNPRAVFYTMPLALVALASALDRVRVEVVVIDGRLESDPVARVVEATEGALCLGVSVLTGAPIRDALAVCRAVKAARPLCCVVWGGWHPSLFASDCVEEPAIDVAVVGQGEDTFAEIVARLASGDSIQGCSGTVTRSTANEQPHAGSPRVLRNLNDFPRHDYSVIPVERYFALKQKRQLDYISSQGCRFRCAFCADPAVFARGWTGLDPVRVADEVQTLHRQYSLDEVAFQDETFFTHPSRIDRLADELLRRNVVVPWTATLRADQACRMGEALFMKAVRAGLRRVMIGVESGSQATLDRLKKDVRLDQVMAAADLCARHDVGVIFNFIVGFPGEPEESVDCTLALAKRLGGMHPRFETPIFYYRPYPGNPIADDARRAGYEFPRGLEAWADFDYVGGRGPWVSDARFRAIERFKFYTRHAWQPGAWRWPLRAASRWRCERDWYAFPLEKALVELVRRPQQVS